VVAVVTATVAAGTLRRIYEAIRSPPPRSHSEKRLHWFWLLYAHFFPVSLLGSLAYVYSIPLPALPFLFFLRDRAIFSHHRNLCISNLLRSTHIEPRRFRCGWMPSPALHSPRLVEIPHRENNICTLHATTRPQQEPPQNDMQRNMVICW
jgi:hypothetical protein